MEQPLPSASAEQSPLRDSAQALSNACEGVSSAASKRVSGFVHSARFQKIVGEVFDEVDIDGSGTMDAAELFVAILLVNHQLNKFPLGKRQEPPTRQQIQALLHSETSGDSLTRAQFLSICQKRFVEVGKGIIFSVLLVFVVCPALGLYLKRFMVVAASYLQGSPAEHAKSLLHKLPDSIYTMAASILHARYGALSTLRKAAPMRLNPAQMKWLAVIVAGLVPAIVALLHRGLSPHAASLLSAARVVAVPGLAAVDASTHLKKAVH